MRYAKVDAKYYCGIDLHSRSRYISVMDKDGEVLLHRNMPNDFDMFKSYVHRFLPWASNRAATTTGWPRPANKRGIPFNLVHAREFIAWGTNDLQVTVG